MQRISPPALTDWRFRFRPRAPGRVSVSGQTSDKQRGTPGAAGGRGPGPSPGAAYLCPPYPPRQPGPQRAKDRQREKERREEECEGGEVKEKVLTEGWRGWLKGPLSKRVKNKEIYRILFTSKLLVLVWNLLICPSRLYQYLWHNRLFICCLEILIEIIQSL